MKALQGLFEELDVDKSGSVSVDELMEGLERLGYDISEAGACRAAHAALCVLCWVSGLGMLEGSGLGVLGYDVTEAGACRATRAVLCMLCWKGVHPRAHPAWPRSLFCVCRDGAADEPGGREPRRQPGAGGVCGRPGGLVAAAGGGGWV